MILMMTFDNYPAGAANDSKAPYNEPIESNETYNFEVSLKGKVNIPHYNEEDLEKKLSNTREVLENISDTLIEKGYKVDVDFDINESFSEVW